MSLYIAAFFLGVLICTATNPPTIIPELNCITGLGVAYRGTIAVTKTGKTCQSWSAQTPHTHDRTPENYPCKDLRENLCRNPDGYSGGPWCYTTDPDTRWELCNIPNCFYECMVCNGEDYRGEISTTENGDTCQRWDSQTPHSHGYSPSTLPGKHLEENYCRNPSGDPRPWCYTTNPSKKWDFCSIPRCNECMVCNGEDYRGKISTTENGDTCQRWDSQTPHSHGYSPSTLPGKHLEENYCRNPSGDPRPWCYTTNPSKKWDYCSIPRCTAEPPQIIPELNCITGQGAAYRGTIAVTATGKTCQSWAAQTPHTHNRTPENYHCKGLDNNYCRNPDNEKRPWCYTTDPDTRWEYCNVVQCSDTPASDDPLN